ncbi:MAG: hypothetical protein ACFFCQ_10570 [Promethearchaeota archaeon]
MKKGKNKEKPKKGEVYPEGQIRHSLNDVDVSLNPVGFERKKLREKNDHGPGKPLKEKKEVWIVPEEITIMTTSAYISVLHTFFCYID